MLVGSSFDEAKLQSLKIMLQPGCSFQELTA